MAWENVPAVSLGLLYSFFLSQWVPLLSLFNVTAVAFHVCSVQTLKNALMHWTLCVNHFRSSQIHKSDFNRRRLEIKK